MDSSRAERDRARARRGRATRARGSAPATSATATTGTFTRKTEPHEKCSSSQPPATGPMATAERRPRRPRCRWPCARSSAREHVGEDRQGGRHDQRAADAHERAGERSAGRAVRAMAPSSDADAEDQQAEPRARALRPKRSPRLPHGQQQAGEHQRVGVDDPLELARSRRPGRGRCVGRATFRIVLSSDTTSSESERTRRVHHRLSYAFVCSGVMSIPSSITIRNGYVSLLKHTERITQRCRLERLRRSASGLGETPRHPGHGAGARPWRRAPGAGASPWRPHLAAADRWADGRQGTVSFAVRTERRVWARDAARAVPAVSVLKVMLLVSYLRRDEVRGRALHPADRALLAPMVRWSDSAAASRVRDIVGNAGLARLARRAGMRHFHAAPIWGDSIVDASDQSRFMLHIERLRAAPPPAHRAQAARLDRALAALGDRARAPTRMGALLQERLGLGQRRGGPPGGPAATRWPPALGGDHDHLEPEPRLCRGDAAGSRGAAAAGPRPAP